MKIARTFNVFLLLALVAALLPVPTAASSEQPFEVTVVLPQGGGTCTSPVDANGNLDLAPLERAGEPYTECIACVNILGGEVGLMTSFDRYVDAQGRHYLVPNFFTSMYMAFTGWAPDFSVGPVDAVLNGFELVATLLGRYENVGGVFALFADLGISPADALRITGKAMADDWSAEDVAGVFQNFAGDVMFWANLNVKLFLDDWNNGNAVSYRSMVLIYCENPLKPDEPPITAAGTTEPFPTTNWTPPPLPTGDPDEPPEPTPVGTRVPPTSTPPPTPTPVPPHTPTPTATPVGGCKASSIGRTGVGTILIEKIAPPNPVVVGQDESQRGVDVHVRIVSPAVIYTYEKWEVVSSETKCCHTDPVTGWKVCQADMSPCDNGWTSWDRETTDKWGCKEYKETYPDPVDLGTLQVRAVLTAESRDWINTELARKYPGARVHHPEWELIPLGGWGRYESTGGDLTYTLDATVRRIPLEDPGQYDLVVSGRTKGTPYTAAVSFGWTGNPFGVILIETALIK